MDTAIRDEIVRRIDRLPKNRQRDALGMIRAMESNGVEGAPGASLADLAGTLTPQEAADMLRVINEEFERIDPGAW